MNADTTKSQTPFYKASPRNLGMAAASLAMSAESSVLEPAGDCSKSKALVRTNTVTPTLCEHIEACLETELSPPHPEIPRRTFKRIVVAIDLRKSATTNANSSDRTRRSGDARMARA